MAVIRTKSPSLKGLSKGAEAPDPPGTGLRQWHELEPGQAGFFMLPGLPYINKLNALQEHGLPSVTAFQEAFTDCINIP
jgi:hypothetical protein